MLRLFEDPKAIGSLYSGERKIKVLKFFHMMFTACGSESRLGRMGKYKRFSFLSSFKLLISLIKELAVKGFVFESFHKDCSKNFFFLLLSRHR